MPFDNSLISEDEEEYEYSARAFAVSREAERRRLLADARQLATEVREQIGLLLIDAEQVEHHAIAAHRRRIREDAERLSTKQGPRAIPPPHHTATILPFPTRR